MRPHFSSQPPVSPQRSDAGGESWEMRAACREVVTEVFFPGDASKDPRKWDGARAVCGACPVRAECLADALAVEGNRATSRHGMFGGLTPEERAVVADRARRAVQRAKERARKRAAREVTA